MSTRPRPFVGLSLVTLWTLAAATGCNTLLDLGDYAVGPASNAGADAAVSLDATAVDAPSGDEPDATTNPAPDASIGADASIVLDASDASLSSDAPNCDADPLTFTTPTQCYACTPTTSPQYANACTNSMCVPFDDTRLTNLLQDGALPPVPLKDAASE